MKLAWAFNPFDDTRRLQRTASELLRRVRGADDTVEIVYVASPGEPRLAVAFDVSVEERYGRYPLRLIERALHRLGVSGTRVTVLRQRRPSLTAAVRTLVGHLHGRRVDLTLVASRARRGMSRVVLGSFAETLVHLAKTDLLVFNDASRVTRGPRVLVFAHDLSAAAERGLRAAIRYARAWRCALHVVHGPVPGYRLAFGAGAAGVDAYRCRVRPQLDHIAAQLRRAGLAGTVVVTAHPYPVVEQILQRVADVHADALLVVAKSGRVAGWLGGSVTRKLLRASPVPVLVLKPG